MTETRRTSSGAKLVAVVCAAQIFVQIGAGFWPALLPQMMQLWQLSNSEAGWITAIFFGAYMVSVPVLVTLTDRIDAKRVYLFGVACTVAGHLLFGLCADGFWSALATRALAGIGWAGTYMTGLKLLADQVDAKTMSRAVTGHAASIGISGAVSFLLGDVLAGQPAALALMARLDGGAAAQLAFAQASNMTESFGALAILLENGQGKQELAAFGSRWTHDRLVMDKWFAVQVAMAAPDQAAATVARLTEHPAFDMKNPNRFRAVLGALTANHAGFHHQSGAGYATLADFIASRDFARRDALVAGLKVDAHLAEVTFLPVNPRPEKIV